MIIQQQYLKIGKIEMPVIVDNNETYYPISFVSEKILLRTGNIVNKSNKDKYNLYIRMLEVNFGVHGIHKTNCISTEGLKKILENVELRRLSVKQRKSQNRLMKHLGLALLPINEFITESINANELHKHDNYTISLIETIMKEKESVQFQMCSKCTKYYPLTSDFFNPDHRLITNYAYICHICSGRSYSFTHTNKELNKIKKSIKDDCESRMELVDAYLLGDPTKIYENYVNKGIKELPVKIRTKDNMLIIIEHLYKKGVINKDNITFNKFKELHLDIKKILTLHEVYVHLFGEGYHLYPWEYKSFSFKEIRLTYKIANKVFSNYINENSIDVSNPLTLDYETLLKKSRLKNLENDTLYFAVQYNDFKFAGYQFKTRGVNYYKKLKNRTFDFKHLIENDLKIPIEKIPLYVTKGYLSRDRKVMYQILRNTYDGNLFKWVNECYPNKFIEADFNINKYRDNFDSIEESQIHSFLCLHFSNVIYNSRNDKQTIKINGMIPDWIIITDNGCWIVEYFGMYSPRQVYNSRVAAYIEKTDDKIKKYNHLENFFTLFIFPEDIKENYEGLKRKLNSIM